MREAEAAGAKGPGFLGGDGERLSESEMKIPSAPAMRGPERRRAETEPEPGVGKTKGA